MRTANQRGEVGAGTLLLVLLDAFMDSVFPVLTLLGDAVDGIARLSVRRPEARHVVLAKRVKQQLHKILKHAWQVPSHPACTTVWHSSPPNNASELSPPCAWPVRARYESNGAECHLAWFVVFRSQECTAHACECVDTGLMVELCRLEPKHE